MMLICVDIEKSMLYGADKVGKRGRCIVINQQQRGGSQV